MTESPVFELEFEVRDYECDIQGIVNNSVYFNYLEHARHKFLLAKNVDFVALHEQGIDLVVSHVDMSFKKSLKPGDVFRVSVVPEKTSVVRGLFKQQITRVSDGTVILIANITWVCTQGGVPKKIDMIYNKFI